MTPAWIADEPVVFVFPNGRREVGRIAVGMPLRVSDDEARCPIALDGLEKLRSINGGSTLQALLLALRFLGMRLHHFRSTGGRVLYPDGKAEIPLEALFDTLLRAPDSRATS